jgi:hypothetical protein
MQAVTQSLKSLSGNLHTAPHAPCAMPQAPGWCRLGGWGWGLGHDDARVEDMGERSRDTQQLVVNGALFSSPECFVRFVQDSKYLSWISASTGTL